MTSILLKSSSLLLFVVLQFTKNDVSAFTSSSHSTISFTSSVSSSTSTTSLNYEPKWKKKETLAEKTSDMNPEDKGIKGDITVLFRTGNETKQSLGFAGQPLKDVASQCGQFIKYGCGKGECGTCEALCNGKYIRPCINTVDMRLIDPESNSITLVLKEVKNKSKSSGKFFSIKSFFKGFYNNLLGMVGLVVSRRAAKKNYQERMEFEDLIAQRTLEKKKARLAAQSKEEE